ncbi:MAG: vWA domain-containing protein [Geminicoccaceae bacterium]
MRRPRRDIQIFSLSALDLLAMATGVFVLLLVLLMPYYRKTFDAGATIEAVRVQTETVTSELEALEQAGAAARKRAEETLTEVARLNSRAEALERARPERPQPERSATEKDERVINALDLIFVIDTTASMRPVIRDLAVSLRGIVRILERLVPSVRIGVVAYKDRDSGLAPVITFPLTPTDPHLSRIVDFVERLQAAIASSRTIEEDVHLGIEAATMMPFRPNARQTLVVIGDAAVHDPLREMTIRRVATFVRGRPERTISSLFTSTPSSKSRGERARPFFKAVANAGDGSFNDHVGSMTESILLSVLVEDPKASSRGK